jgi:hypothetical protein
LALFLLGQYYCKSDLFARPYYYLPFFERPLPRELAFLRKIPGFAEFCGFAWNDMQSNGSAPGTQ